MAPQLAAVPVADRPRGDARSRRVGVGGDEAAHVASFRLSTALRGLGSASIVVRSTTSALAAIAFESGPTERPRGRVGDESPGANRPLTNTSVSPPGSRSRSGSIAARTASGGTTGARRQGTRVIGWTPVYFQSSSRMDGRPRSRNSARARARNGARPGGSAPPPGPAAARSTRACGAGSDVFGVGRGLAVAVVTQAPPRLPPRRRRPRRSPSPPVSLRGRGRRTSRCGRRRGRGRRPGRCSRGDAGSA